MNGKYKAVSPEEIAKQNEYISKLKETNDAYFAAVGIDRTG